MKNATKFSVIRKIRYFSWISIPQISLNSWVLKILILIVLPVFCWQFQSSFTILSFFNHNQIIWKTIIIHFPIFLSPIPSSSHHLGPTPTTPVKLLFWKSPMTARSKMHLFDRFLFFYTLSSLHLAHIRHPIICVE